MLWNVINIVTGYYKVLNELDYITKTLKLISGAKDKLTRLYQQKEWLGIEARQAEEELVTLALNRIEQDPSQFDLFIDMLRNIEGMDLIVTTLTGGELRYSVCYTHWALRRKWNICIQHPRYACWSCWSIIAREFQNLHYIRNVSIYSYQMLGGWMNKRIVVSKVPRCTHRTHGFMSVGRLRVPIRAMGLLSYDSIEVLLFIMCFIYHYITDQQSDLWSWF